MVGRGEPRFGGICTDTRTLTRASSGPLGPRRDCWGGREGEGTCLRNIAEKAGCNGSDSPVTSRGSSRATPWALAPLLSPEDHAPRRGRPLPPQPREGHPCPLRGLCTGQSQTAAATVLCLQGVFFSRAYQVSSYIRFSRTNKCHRFRSSLFPPITLSQARSHCSPGGGEPRGTQDAPPGSGSLFLPASHPCDPSPRPPSGSAGSTQTVPSSPGRGTSQEQAPGWKSFLWPQRGANAGPGSGTVQIQK